MRNWFPALLALVVLPAAASDVWKVKPVEEWTREETQDFFRDSPWVHKVIVNQASLPTQPVRFPGPGGESPRRPSNVEGLKVEPPFSANGEASRTVYYIEWTSAKIVRRAGAHYRALEGQ